MATSDLSGPVAAILVAARTAKPDDTSITVAVLRCLADHAPADAGYVWHPRSLRALADEIEADSKEDDGGH